MSECDKDRPTRYRDAGPRTFSEAEMEALEILASIREGVRSGECDDDLLQRCLNALGGPEIVAQLMHDDHPLPSLPDIQSAPSDRGQFLFDLAKGFWPGDAHHLQKVRQEAGELFLPVAAGLGTEIDHPELPQNIYATIVSDQIRVERQSVTLRWRSGLGEATAPSVLELSSRDGRAEPAPRGVWLEAAGGVTDVVIDVGNLVSDRWQLFWLVGNEGRNVLEDGELLALKKLATPRAPRAEQPSPAEFVAQGMLYDAWITCMASGYTGWLLRLLLHFVYARMSTLVDEAARAMADTTEADACIRLRSIPLQEISGILRSLDETIFSQAKRVKLPKQ